MRFYDLILGMKDWDLKDELEIKNVAMRTHSPSALKTFLYLLQI